MPKKVTKKNFTEVLLSIQQKFSEAGSEAEKKVWSDSVNKMLDKLRDEDFFGTEGQLDPRGDNRDEE